MTTPRTAPARQPATTRLSALALAGLLTLAMLAGVNGLARSDVAPAQLAQASAPHA